MIGVPSDDPLGPWREGASVSAEEAVLLQEYLEAEAGDRSSALLRMRSDAEQIDAEAEPYRAVLLWSILVRQSLLTGDPDSYRTLSDIRELAEAIRYAGNRKTLVPLYQWLLDRWLVLEDEDGPNTAISFVQLGHAFDLSGEKAKAIEFKQEGYQRCQIAFGNHSRETILAAIQFASILNNSKRKHEAIKITEGALRVAKDEFGIDDRLTLNCLQESALIYVKLGERPHAMRIGEQVYSACLRVLATDHPMTLLAQASLGRRKSAEGDRIIGMDFTGKAHEKLEILLGEHHPASLTALSFHAANVGRSGAHRKSRDLRKKCLRLREIVFGVNHSFTWSARNDLGFACGQAGDLEEAVRLYREVYVHRRAVDPSGEPVQMSMNNLGVKLMQLGQFKEALHLLKLNYRVRRLNDHKALQPKKGAYSVSTITSLKNLGLCLANAGFADQALPLLRQALESRINKSGEDHPSVAIVWQDLGKCFKRLSRYPEAVEAFQETLNIRKAKFSALDFRTMQSASELVDVLLLAGDPVPAYELHAEALVSILALVPGGTTWFALTLSAARHTAELISLGYALDWRPVFRELGARYVELLDLTDPEELIYLRGHFARFHSAWLSLCLGARDGAGEIPQVLSAISGRETAALVLSDLEAQNGEFGEQDLRGQYLDVLRDLRRLGMMLRAQTEISGEDGAGDAEGAGAGDGGRDGDRKMRLDPEMAKQIRQNRASSRNDLVTRHDGAMARYKALRTELTETDATFARAYAAPDVSALGLRQLLRRGEGLALLFSHHGADGTNQYHACCLTHDGQMTLLALPDLGIALSAVQAVSRPIRVQQINPRGMRGGQDLFTGATSLDSSAVDETVEMSRSLDNPAAQHSGRDVHFSEHIRAGLWTLLLAHSPDVEHWHIATHQDLHLLPVHLGLDASRRCSVYPGLIFFWLNRKAAADPVLFPPRMLIHVDPAEGSEYPIPFVEAEINLLKSIWGADSVEILRSDATIARLKSSESPIDTLVLVAHGDELKGPPRQTVIWADAVRGLQIDANMLLSAAQRPQTAIASACVVGRVSEDEGGEPLGLVAAFFVSGGRFVLAPLQPVDDLYMPIFMGLFHLAWQASGDPGRALILARQQALGGEWPDGFSELVREAYEPVMTKQIKDAFALRDNETEFKKRLSDIQKSWLLPDWGLVSISAALNSGRGSRENNPLYKVGRQEALVSTAIEVMLPRIGKRAPVHPRLRDIVNWTVGFGG